MIPWWLYRYLLSSTICIITYQCSIFVDHKITWSFIKWNRIIFLWNSFDPDPINTPEIKWNVFTWVWSPWPGLRCWVQRTGSPGSRCPSQAETKTLTCRRHFVCSSRLGDILLSLWFYIFFSQTPSCLNSIFSEGDIKTIQHVTDKSPISRSAPSYHNQQQQQPSETRCKTNESLNIVIFKWNIKLPPRKS